MSPKERGVCERARQRESASGPSLNREAGHTGTRLELREVE